MEQLSVQPRKKLNVKKLVRLGMLAAVSLILVYFVHFSIFPGAPFLEYDPADVPILIGTFMMGPVAGLILTAVVSLLQWLLISPAGGPLGALMHFVATGAFVLVAGNLYRCHRTLKGAIVALILGALAMIVIMIPVNILITPIYVNAPVEMVLELLVPILLPFNAIKAVGNAVITFLLYKPVSRVLKLERPHSKQKDGKTTDPSER